MRSADVMRRTVIPPLSPVNNQVDRYVRLVFTGTGPAYWNADALAHTDTRRVGYADYTQEFAQQVYLESLVCGAKAPTSCMAH